MTQIGLIQVLASNVESLLKLSDRLDAEGDCDEDLVLAGVVRDCAREMSRALATHPRGPIAREVETVLQEIRRRGNKS